MIQMNLFDIHPVTEHESELCSSTWHHVHCGNPECAKWYVLEDMVELVKCFCPHCGEKNLLIEITS